MTTVEYFKVLQNRDLAILWLSQVFSAIGDQLYSLAVIWIAVQQAGAGAGLVAAAGTTAGLVLRLLGGVYADRWNRRTTMIVVDLLRACAVLTLPIAAQFMPLTLWHLAVVAAIVGGLGALFDPALQASLPTLVNGPRSLQTTNSLMDMTQRLARALGPGFSGILVSLLPMHHFFSIDAVSFVVSAVAVLSLGRSFSGQITRQAEEHHGLFGIATEIRQAIKLVRAHRPLAWSFGILFVSILLWSIQFTVGIPLLIKQELKASVSFYGLVVAAYGIGNVISSLVVGSLHIQRRMLVLCVGKVVMATGFLIIALAPNPVLTLLGAALAAVGGPMGDIMILTMMQTDIPEEHLGKVYSLSMFSSGLGATFGLILAPLFFQYVSASLGIAFCAVVMAICGIVGLLRFASPGSVRNPA